MPQRYEVKALPGTTLGWAWDTETDEPAGLLRPYEMAEAEAEMFNVDPDLQVAAALG